MPGFFKNAIHAIPVWLESLIVFILVSFVTQLSLVVTSLEQLNGPITWSDVWLSLLPALLAAGVNGYTSWKRQGNGAPIPGVSADTLAFYERMFVTYVLPEIVKRVPDAAVLAQIANTLTPPTTPTPDPTPTPPAAPAADGTDPQTSVATDPAPGPDPTPDAPVSAMAIPAVQKNAIPVIHVTAEVIANGIR